MNLKPSFFVTIWKVFKSTVQRNKTVLKATALSLFLIITLSILLTIFAFSVAPWLVDWFKYLIRSERLVTTFPPPHTLNLYLHILQNNTGHFWNPAKMLVWVPFLGTFFLALELLLNSVTIGAISVFIGKTRGIFYPIVGLTPHGVFEIPAFIFQFASLIRWHVTITEFIMAKIVGERVEGAKLRQGLKDTVVLAIISLTLFIIAAYVETYITPYLLGM